MHFPSPDFKSIDSGISKRHHQGKNPVESRDTDANLIDF